MCWHFSIQTTYLLYSITVCHTYNSELIEFIHTMFRVDIRGRIKAVELSKLVKSWFLQLIFTTNIIGTSPKQYVIGFEKRHTLEHTLTQ